MSNNPIEQIHLSYHDKKAAVQVFDDKSNMNEFIYPYGADRNPQYLAFKQSRVALLEEYNNNVLEKPYLQSIYQLRYSESLNELLKVYSDILIPMAVDEYMKEFGLNIGDYIMVGTPLKLVDAKNNYLIFEDMSKINTSMSFPYKKCDPPTKEFKDSIQEITIDMYSKWSKQLAVNYTREELYKQLTKCELLTDKYAKSHLRAIERTTSMKSNSQSRAQTGNVLRANYERKTALKNAIEIIDRFPDFVDGSFQSNSFI